MSTTTAAHAAGTDLGVTSPMRRRGTPMATLIAVELRKAVDTRSGRWLLIVTALVTLGGGAIGAFAVTAELRSYAVIGRIVFQLELFLLPVVAILLVTSEFSQRSALTTFSLTPRRGRILTAKAGAVLVLAVLGWAVAVGVTALATAVAARPALFPADQVWGLTAGGLAESLLYVALTVVFGFELGLAFLNSPAAIVLRFVPFLVYPILGAFIGWVRDHLQPWTDPGASWALLLAGGSGNPNGPPPSAAVTALSGQQWAQVAVTAAIWVGVPVAVGSWRMLTREVS